MPKSPAVYMLASRFNGTLYIGVTSHLLRRVWKHRTGLHEGFTKRYAIVHLVWYEVHATMADAILREKRLKKWPREWKVRLIAERNPYWTDLWPELTGSGDGSPPARG